MGFIVNKEFGMLTRDLLETRKRVIMFMREIGKNRRKEQRGRGEESDQTFYIRWDCPTLKTVENHSLGNMSNIKSFYNRGVVFVVTLIKNTHNFGTRSLCIQFDILW